MTSPRPTEWFLFLMMTAFWVPDLFAQSAVSCRSCVDRISADPEAWGCLLKRIEERLKNSGKADPLIIRLSCAEGLRIKDEPKGQRDPILEPGPDDATAGGASPEERPKILTLTRAQIACLQANAADLLVRDEDPLVFVFSESCPP